MIVSKRARFIILVLNLWLLYPLGKTLSVIGPFRRIAPSVAIDPHDPVLVSAAQADSPSEKDSAKRHRGQSLEVQEKIVAGSSQDSVQVRHLVLRGSNYEIGKTLAEIARDRHHVRLSRSVDKLRTRAMRRYFKERFPLFFERMRGVADAYGKSIEDDSFDFSSLVYLLSPPGCSVVFYPPQFTETGTGVLSRNYDFTTGTFDRHVPGPGRLGATARPYIIELHPDTGYPSLYLSSYDLLGGTIDGINSEGLVVALLADDELMANFPMEPTRQPAVGFNEIQILRYLLDTCANVDEAKEALLSAKQYYLMAQCHYIIADRHGKSFVWEYSHAHNREYIIDGNGQPQITTNFMLHRHPKVSDLPTEAYKFGAFNRYRAIDERIANGSGKRSLDFIKQASACVQFDSPAPGSGLAPTRTLWHALYFPEKRRLQIDFYLRDEPDPATPGKTKIIRSGYLEFQLKD